MRAIWSERGWVAALGLGLALGVTAPAAAQQAAPPEPKPAETTPAEKKQEAGKEPEKTPPRARSKDVFVPSEKVPADAAVSFPVEI